MIRAGWAIERDDAVMRAVLGCVRSLGSAWVCGLRVVLVVVCLGGLSVAGVPVARAAGSCGNEAIRDTQGTAALSLPECRAYELVTPPGEPPNLANATTADVGVGLGDVEAQAAGSGGAVVYHSFYPPDGTSDAGQIYDATRDGEGWVTGGLEPSKRPKVTTCNENGSAYFSADLTAQVFKAFPACGVDDPVLVPGEPTGTDNLFVRSPLSAPFALVDVTPSGVTPPANEDDAANFQDASADFSHVLFSEDAPLTVDAPAGDDLYEWTSSGVRLVTYLPDGAPVLGTIADASIPASSGFGSSAPVLAHVVSGDGERVVFVAGGALYLRVNVMSAEGSGHECGVGLACTVQLDRAQPGATGTSGGGEFWWASADGSRVFFTDESDLTAGATAVKGKPDLYEYDVETGGLSDLTVDGKEPAGVLGVLTAGEDGSYVYFVAEGVLSESRSAEGRLPQVGKPNLYVHHGGVTTFVATLSPGDTLDWGASGNTRAPGSIEGLSTLSSPDGSLVAFNSIARLTGYDNAPEHAGECEGTSSQKESVCDEIFLYDAVSNRLVCVSCGEVGVLPAGIAELRGPAGTYPRRALMADGRVFFDTPSSLSPQDLNGVSNVYEWAPVGVGECGEESASYSSLSEGCVYSISSGTSPEPSYFVDASESGEDVYFATSQSLVGEDTDNGLSIYDARVGGGLVSQAGPVEPPVCRGEGECRSPLTEAPGGQLPGTVSAYGPGNTSVSSSSSGSVAGASGAGARRLTRAQELARALKVCAGKPKRKRASCDAAAHKKYGPKRRQRAKAKKGGAKKGGAR